MAANKNLTEFEEVAFKIPGLLYQALIEERKKSGKPRIGLMLLYFELARSEFRLKFAYYFDCVQQKEAAEKGSLSMADLPRFGLSISDYYDVVNDPTESQIIHSRRVPKEYLEVARFIGECLESEKSGALLFRLLTEKIVIRKLLEEIEDLMD